MIKNEIEFYKIFIKQEIKFYKNWIKEEPEFFIAMLLMLTLQILLFILYMR